MKKRIHLFRPSVLACAACLAALPVFAQNTTISEGEKAMNETLVIKNVDGLKFSVPEDRPIEKKHSIVAPMPLDQYVALKFLRLEERLKGIEDSIERVREDVDLLKGDVQSLQARNQTMQEE